MGMLTSFGNHQNQIHPMADIDSNSESYQNEDSFFTITSIEAEGYMKGEYNRGIYNYGEFSLIGAVELGNLLNFKTGIALGINESSNDICTFLTVSSSPFTFPLLSMLTFSLSYIYNGFPGYEAHEHSIFPHISFNTDRFEFTFGSSFRFTTFFVGKAQVESIFSFNVLYYFIYNESFILGMNIGTFNDFRTRNTGAYYVTLKTNIILNSSWKIVNDIELMQSGGDGLSAAFYGISLRTGAKFTW